jgi:hypothetical protein
MKAILFVLMMCSAYVSAVTYRQCDGRWGSNALAGGSKTICQIGCAMTSLSMILADNGIQAGGSVVNPGSLNTWLKSNGGYSGNLLIWGATDKLGKCKYEGKKYSGSDYKSCKACGKYVILNVHNGGHWVFMEGLSGDKYTSRDPGNSSDPLYPISDIREAAVYRC